MASVADEGTRESGPQSGSESSIKRARITFDFGGGPESSLEISGYQLNFNAEFSNDKLVVTTDLNALKVRPRVDRPNPRKYWDGDPLQQQLREGGTTPSRDEIPAVVPRRRQRTPSEADPEDDDGSLLYGSGSESCDDDKDVPPPPKAKRFKLNGFSREQIRAVLGGSDRAWGSCLTRPGLGTKYKYLAYFDAEAHLFKQEPSCGQDIAEAAVGHPDDEVIYGSNKFPLFVHDRKWGTGFEYMGNYVATKLEPGGWERLSQQEKETLLYFTRYSPGSHHKLRDTKYLRGQLDTGAIKLPRYRLEFQDFDEKLFAGINEAPRRLKRRLS